MKELIGLVIDRIEGLEKQSDEVRIYTKCGRAFKFYHIENCCESVYLCDFEVDEIIGAEIIAADELTNSESMQPDTSTESWQWTFYRINTTNGELWMRWLGESNGYYSEDVDFAEITQTNYS